MTDILNRKTVAKLAGVCVGTIRYHEDCGYLPAAPKVGLAAVYDAESARRVVAYFAARKRWQWHGSRLTCPETEEAE